MKALKSKFSLICTSKVTFLFVCAFFLALILGHNWQFAINHVFTSSKENVSLALIEQFAHHLNLSIPLEHIGISQELQSALTPRDAAQLNGSVVPQTFPGILLIYGLFAAISPFILLILNPLVFALIIFVFYKIIERIYTSKIAFIGASLLLFMPNFVYLGSSLISDDMLSLLFLLSSLYLLLLKRYLPFSAFLLGLAIFVRPPNLIWALPLLIFALSKAKDTRYFINLRHFFISIISFLIPIILIFLVNYWIYGSAIKTGYQLQYPIFQELVGTESGLFKSSIDDVALQIKNYLIFLYPLPFMLSIWGLYKLRSKKSKIFPWMLLIIAIFFLLTFQYAGSIFWGNKNAALNSSFLRYTLPFFLILPALCAYVISSWAKRWQLFGILILIVSFAFTALQFRGGLKEKWSQETLSYELQQSVLSYTDANALIFTDFQDKFIFPKRQTVTMQLLREEKAYGYAQTSPWLAPLDYETIATNMLDLKAKNIPFIILIQDKNDITNLQSELTRHATDNFTLLKPLFALENIAAYSLD